MKNQIIFSKRQLQSGTSSGATLSPIQHRSTSSKKIKKTFFNKNLYLNTDNYFHSSAINQDNKSKSIFPYLKTSQMQRMNEFSKDKDNPFENSRGIRSFENAQLEVINLKEENNSLKKDNEKLKIENGKLSSEISHNMKIVEQILMNISSNNDEDLLIDKMKKLPTESIARLKSNHDLANMRELNKRLRKEIEYKESIIIELKSIDKVKAVKMIKDENLKLATEVTKLLEQNEGLQQKLITTRQNNEEIIEDKTKLKDYITAIKQKYEHHDSQMVELSKENQAVKEALRNMHEKINVMRIANSKLEVRLIEYKNSEKLTKKLQSRNSDNVDKKPQLISSVTQPIRALKLKAKKPSFVTERTEDLTFFASYIKVFDQYGEAIQLINQLEACELDLKNLLEKERANISRTTKEMLDLQAQIDQLVYKHNFLNQGLTIESDSFEFLITITQEIECPQQALEIHETIKELENLNEEENQIVIISEDTDKKNEDKYNESNDKAHDQQLILNNEVRASAVAGQSSFKNTVRIDVNVKDLAEITRDKIQKVVQKDQILRDTSSPDSEMDIVMPEKIDDEGEVYHLHKDIPEQAQENLNEKVENNEQLNQVLNQKDSLNKEDAEMKHIEVLKRVSTKSAAIGEDSNHNPYFKSEFEIQHDESKSKSTPTVSDVSNVIEKNEEDYGSFEKISSIFNKYKTYKHESKSIEFSPPNEKKMIKAYSIDPKSK